MSFEKTVLLCLIFLVENMEPHTKDRVNELHREFFTKDHEELKKGLISMLDEELERIKRGGKA